MSESVGLIGKGIEFTGDINFEGTLRIEGQVSGTIKGETGTVSIGDSGNVKADIISNICIIDGTLEGDLQAKTKVEITKTGRLRGNVITRDLVIAEGAIFEGSLEMVKESGFATMPDRNEQQTLQTA